MYLIQAGNRFVHWIDERYGLAHWTTDRAEAKRFRSREHALTMADGIGRVVAA